MRKLSRLCSVGRHSLYLKEFLFPELCFFFVTDRAMLYETIKSYLKTIKFYMHRAKCTSRSFIYLFISQILKEFLLYAEAEVRSLASLYSGVVCH